MRLTHAHLQLVAQRTRTRARTRALTNMHTTRMRIEHMRRSAQQVGTYDLVKTKFKANGWLADGVLLHCVASVAGALVLSTAVLPLDVLLTRFLRMCPSSMLSFWLYEQIRWQLGLDYMD